MSAAASDRAGICPLCGATHVVTPADRAGVSTREALLTAHYRAEIRARSEQPFFLPATARRSTRRGAL